MPEWLFLLKSYWGGLRCKDGEVLLFLRDVRIFRTMAQTLITIRITTWQTGSYHTWWETNKLTTKQYTRWIADGFSNHDKTNDLDQWGQTAWPSGTHLSSQSQEAPDSDFSQISVLSCFVWWRLYWRCLRAPDQAGTRLGPGLTPSQLMSASSRHSMFSSLLATALLLLSLQSGGDFPVLTIFID